MPYLGSAEDVGAEAGLRSRVCSSAAVGIPRLQRLSGIGMGIQVPAGGTLLRGGRGRG